MAGLLENRTAVVTGGATGIGEAICKRLAREGARVVVNGLPGDPVDQVVLEIRQAGGAAESFYGDVSAPHVAAGLVQKAQQIFSCVDICVANAGKVYYGGKIGAFDLALFEEIVRNNLYGYFHTLQAALPELAKTKGVLITIGAEESFIGQPLAGPYAATKAALHALAMTAAREYADAPVRVVNISPGPVETAMIRSDVGPMPAEMAQRIRCGTLLGRCGSPEEVANVVAFIASDQASFITGTDLLVDGGMSIARGLPVPSSPHAAPQETLDLQHKLEGYHPPEAA